MGVICTCRHCGAAGSWRAAACVQLCGGAGTKHQQGQHKTPAQAGTQGCYSTACVAGRPTMDAPCLRSATALTQLQVDMHSLLLLAALTDTLVRCTTAGAEGCLPSTGCAGSLPAVQDVTTHGGTAKAAGGTI